MNTLTCPSCGSAVSATAKFCSECGTKLGTAVATGAPPVPERLVERMRADAAQMAGERKLVTVLFADIVGSMDLAEQVDPERWREIMTGVSERLGGAVHRYEGTVDKFTGDGIMALFGAPIAHEDHARRACLAAIEMQTAIGDLAGDVRRSDGISLVLRVGINSGEVVVGGIGEDLGLDYTAVGHTVGLAQRMEGLAEPGSAYATESTARLAEGLVEFEDLGEFAVRGAQQPIAVHKVVGEGVSGRFDVSRRRGLSRLVGREAEIEQLKAALGAVVDDGQAQVIGIVAQAGTGKSRLCHELRQLAEARGVKVYGTECQAHATEIPLAPVLKMLRAYFGIEPTDLDQAAREKAAGRLLLLDRGFEQDLPVLFDFLGIPDPARPAPLLSSDARKQRLLALVSKVMATRSEVEPAVNIIEDLHWIDPASEEFLRGMIDATPGSRSLTIANYRPEYEAEWLDRDWCSEMRVEPLSEAAIAELLDSLLGADPSLDGLAERIIARTGGNPFYIEETVRSLIESGALEGERGAYRLAGEVSAIEVPATVQAILAARIDRLGPEAKSVLHTASAIGGLFRRDLLEQAADVGVADFSKALDGLIEAEFIARTGRAAVHEFEFVHPLTREVAYGEQLGPDRRARHRAIAEAMIEVHGERLDDHAAEIAHHFEQAGEALLSARWHGRAFERLRTTNFGAAATHLRRVRALGQDLPPGEETDRMKLLANIGLLQASWRVGTPDFDELADAYERAVELSQGLGDPISEAVAHAQYGVTRGICQGRVSDYYELTRTAFAILQRSGLSDPAMAVIAHTSYPYSAFLTGRYEESLAGLDEILRLTEEDRDLAKGVVLQDPRSFATGMRALPLMGLGRFDEALEAALAGIEMGRRHDRESMAWSHTFAAAVYVWGGRSEYEEGARHARAAIEIGLEMGQSQARILGKAFLGALSIRAGANDEGVRKVLDARESIRSEHVVAEFEPFVAAVLSGAYLELRRTDEALFEAEHAYRQANDTGNRSFLGFAQAQLAEALIAAGTDADLARAAAILDEAGQAPGGAGGGFSLPQHLRARSRLHGARGELEQQAAALDSALALAREMNAHGLIAELEAEPAATSN